MVRLLEPLRVVRMNPSGEGWMVTLPAGATVELTGETTLPGYVQVRCANVLYIAFECEVRGSSSLEVGGDTLR